MFEEPYCDDLEVLYSIIPLGSVGCPSRIILPRTKHEVQMVHVVASLVDGQSISLSTGSPTLLMLLCSGVSYLFHGGNVGIVRVEFNAGVSSVRDRRLQPREQ